MNDFFNKHYLIIYGFMMWIIGNISMYLKIKIDSRQSIKVIIDFDDIQEGD